MEKEILQLFKYSRGTYYSWKREQRPIISLIEKYFKEEDLQEFLETGEIFKLELLQHFDYELLEDVNNFFYNEKTYFSIDFLLTFLYLSKNILLENYNKSTFAYYDYYLYDVLEKFKMDYQIKSKEILNIDIEEFNEKYKDLHIALLNIKYPVYKYLIYNLKYNFKPWILTYRNSKTTHLQDLILMLPFAKELDFKNIKLYQDTFKKNHLGFVEDKIMEQIIEADNDHEKIKKIINNKA